MPPTDDQPNLSRLRYDFIQIPITPNPSTSSHNKILCFFFKALAMALFISLLLLFLGIALVAFLHFSLVGIAFHLHHFRRRQSTSIMFCYKCSTQAYSQEELRKYLPTLLHTGSAAGHNCPICLDFFEDGEPTCCLPSCGHLFHLNCVEKWLTKVANCPVCRGIVRLVSDLNCQKDPKFC